MSSPPRKNISLNTSGKSPLLIWPSRPTRGVAHVTNARWDAMDATASGAQGIAGRIELRERSSGARTNGAAKLPSPELAGTHEHRRELWRDGRGRRSRVVLTPPCWRQVWWRCIRLNRACDVSSIRKATVAKVQGSPGRPRISRNPSRRESRMIRFTCGPLVRFLRATAGAIGARLSLRPSFSGRVKLMQASGVSRRENADAYPRDV